MKFSKYLTKLQKHSKLYFTLEEAATATDSPKKLISAKIYHLMKKGHLISPLKGLYIIIPLEHRNLKSVPARDLIVLVMKYLNIPYYVGLLTAARYHGATHQATFVYQVMSSKRIKKELISGDIRIQFIYKKDVKNVEKIKKQVSVGNLVLSNPEETAKDIMIYYKQCGGLNHQATVLSELTEAINTKKLISLAKRSKGLFWVQRMGYILENIDTFYEKDRDRVVASLEKFLATQKLRYVPLAPEMPTKDKPRNKKWKIIENTTVESDI